MHPAKLLVALAISATLASPAFAEDSAKDVAPVPAGALAGAYRVNGDSTEVVFIEAISGRYFRIRRPGEWDGVGVFDGRVLWGALRYEDGTSERHLAGSNGGFRAVADASGTLAVQGAFVYGWSGRFNGVWERVADAAPAAAPTGDNAAPASAPQNEAKP